MSRFYEFRQNNSGGGFDIDEERGLTVHVIVEADSVSDANIRAERIGLYFDGIEYDDEGENIGRDCDCCGSRWSEFYGWGDGENGDEVPSIYGRPLVEFGTEEHKAGEHYLSPMRWAGDLPDAFVHLKDGRKFGFVLTEDGQYVYKGDPADLMEALPSVPVKAIES